MTGIRHTDVKDFWKKSLTSKPQSLRDSPLLRGAPPSAPSPGALSHAHRPAPENIFRAGYLPCLTEYVTFMYGTLCDEMSWFWSCDAGTGPLSLPKK